MVANFEVWLVADMIKNVVCNGNTQFSKLNNVIEHYIE